MVAEELMNRLGITIPIIQAGMAGGPTTPELVAQVSKTGALGTFGAGYLPPDQIRDAIRKIRSMTDKPFAVNLLVYEYLDVQSDKVSKARQSVEPFRRHLGLGNAETMSKPIFTLEHQLQVILEEHVPIFSFTFGLLTEEQIHQLHQNGTVIIGTATTVQEACILESLHVDVIVAQGSEAGGHRGTFANSFESALIGTMSLVPQIKKSVTCPVIAAGGIMNGSQMAAALALGASGVQMGTAFLTVSEAGTNELHRQAILHSEDTSTVVTDVFSGKPARGIRNQFIEQMTNENSTVLPYPMQNGITREIRKEAAKQGQTNFMSLWAGQSSALARACTASDLVFQVLHEYHEALSRLTPIGVSEE